MNKVADNKKKVKHGNLGILVACTAVVGGMVGAAYAAVPLYKLHRIEPRRGVVSEIQAA